MQKTLLESQLERTLQELQMPLGERIYAAELDFQADMEDLTSEIKSRDYQQSKSIEKISWDISPRQQWKGQQPRFIRTSEVYNGLGFYGSIPHRIPLREFLMIH